MLTYDSWLVGIRAGNVVFPLLNFGREVGDLLQ